MTSPTIPLELRLASEHLGADVDGVDLRHVIEQRDEALLSEIRDLLDRYLVLRFRRQFWDVEHLKAFAGQFGPGPLIPHLNRADDAVHVPGHPEISVISNVRLADGRSAGVAGEADLGWHTDGAHLPAPPAVVLFSARQAPKSGPATFWLNMYRIYELLPEALKGEIAGAYAIHPAFNNCNDRNAIEGPSIDVEQRAIGARHPLARMHPRTGRISLYIPKRRDALVVGRSPEDSRTLMDRLWDVIDQADCFWGVAVEEGDFVIWDGRVTLHRRERHSGAAERTMWNFQIAGEIPIAAPQPDQACQVNSALAQKSSIRCCLH